MNQYAFANNAVTTLGSSLSSPSTTLTVATGTGSEFPTPGAGQVVPLTLIAAGSTTGVPNEIVYATARTGDTFTVIRGQEGTTAQAWNSGDTVANMATAEFYNEQATSSQIQAQAGNYAADSGAANSGIVSLSPAPANQAALIGVPVRVKKMSNPNTGAYTLNVNGFGAQAVTLGGRPMESGQLVGNGTFEVFWDGANYELASNPALISNSGLAQMAMDTVKANITGGSANPSDVTISSLLTAMGFGSVNLSPKGHYTFPGGLILQWAEGVYDSGDSTQQTVNWDIPFPSTSFPPLVATLGGPNISSDSFYRINSWTRTGVTVEHVKTNTDYANDAPVVWAVGV